KNYCYNKGPKRRSPSPRCGPIPAAVIPSHILPKLAKVIWSATLMERSEPRSESSTTSWASRVSKCRSQSSISSPEYTTLHRVTASGASTRLTISSSSRPMSPSISTRTKSWTQDGSVLRSSSRCSRTTPRRA
ncbi:MAG: hypothetical protein M1823_006539, partial [Watsoniomyces obsoletus]